MALSNDLRTLQPNAQGLRPGLMIDPLESPGFQISEEETDAIIRQTLAAQPRLKGREALPDIVPQDELTGRRRNKRHIVTTRVSPCVSQPTEPAAARAPDTKSVPPVDLGTARPRRSWRKPVMYGGLGLFIYVWPWAIPIAIFVTFWVVLIACATLGSDWIGRSVSWVFLRVQKRSPARAERLLDRADAMALRFDVVLDRLPERWSEGMYLPDLSHLRQAVSEQNDRADPFDRITSEALQT